MATCPMPWFPIYASEMLGDEDFISWSPEERGCWITLSARCWADGSIPADIDRMAKLCGCDTQAMLKHWSSIASKFEKVDGLERYTSRRIEIERGLAIEKSEKLSRRGKAGAATRWCDEKRDMLKQCSSNTKAMLDDATLPLPLPLPLEKNTPLTPQGGNRGTRTRKVKQDELTEDVPVEILAAVNAIMDMTPSMDRENRKIRAARPEVLIRVQGILSEREKVGPDILVEAWKNYLASDPKSIKAPQYFFGKAENQGENGANWYPWAKAIFVRRQLAEKGGE